MVGLNVIIDIWISSLIRDKNKSQKKIQPPASITQEVDFGTLATDQVDLNKIVEEAVAEPEEELEDDKNDNEAFG